MEIFNGLFCGIRRIFVKRIRGFLQGVISNLIALNEICNEPDDTVESLISINSFHIDYFVTWPNIARNGKFIGKTDEVWLAIVSVLNFNCHNTLRSFVTATQLLCLEINNFLQYLWSKKTWKRTSILFITEKQFEKKPLIKLKKRATSA